MRKTKEKILQKITVLFDKKGYEKTSVREIGKALNMSNSGLYYYFDNKQEMLFDIINDFMEKVLTNLRENMDLIQSPEERILYVIQSHIRFFIKYPAQTKVVIYENHALGGKYAEKMKKKHMEYINIVKKELKEIIRVTGVKMDIGVATFCLLGTMNWITKWYKPKGRVSPEPLAWDIYCFFLRGLKKDPTAQSSYKK
ncbi:TetR/AcrR family transcriptional regulator [Thermodesulfobacteriota bacterium]